MKDISGFPHISLVKQKHKETSNVHQQEVTILLVKSASGVETVSGRDAADVADRWSTGG